MKLLLVAGIIGLSIGVAAAKPNAVADLYEQLYPSDHAKRQALELCFLANRQFNRLDPDEREACYRQRLLLPPLAPVMPAALPPASAPNANFVDFWRASGQGRMPLSDVRSQQQNDRYLHPAGR